MLFAGKLRQLREVAGISQKELAEKIGVSTVMISQYENGKKMPGRDTIIRIANFFDVSTSHLMEENKEEEISEEIIILNRAAKKMTKEQRTRLLEMARVMFKEEFSNNDGETKL